jgi:hypothetical protein
MGELKHTFKDSILCKLENNLVFNLHIYCNIKYPEYDKYSRVVFAGKFPCVNCYKFSEVSEERTTFTFRVEE